MSRCLKTLALLASICFLTIGLSFVRDATLYSFLHLFVFSIALKTQYYLWFQILDSKHSCLKFVNKNTWNAASAVLNALRYLLRDSSLWYWLGSASAISFIRSFRSFKSASLKDLGGVWSDIVTVNSVTSINIQQQLNYEILKSANIHSQKIESRKSSLT